MENRVSVAPARAGRGSDPPEKNTTTESTLDVGNIGFLFVGQPF